VEVKIEAEAVVPQPASGSEKKGPQTQP
jgi:hypothetical protein